jgi:hypothetical protein
MRLGVAVFLASSSVASHSRALLRSGLLRQRAYLCVVPRPISAASRSLPQTDLRCSPDTVLSWLNFTVTLSALAAGLLNFGDQVGRISAAMFSFVGECAGELGCGRRKRRKEAGADCALEEAGLRRYWGQSVCSAARACDLGEGTCREEWGTGPSGLKLPELAGSPQSGSPSVGGRCANLSAPARAHSSYCAVRWAGHAPPHT